MRRTILALTTVLTTLLSGCVASYEQVPASRTPVRTVSPAPVPQHSPGWNCLTASACGAFWHAYPFEDDDAITGACVANFWGGIGTIACPDGRVFADGVLYRDGVRVRTYLTVADLSWRRAVDDRLGAPLSDVVTTSTPDACWYADSGTTYVVCADGASATS